MKERQSQSKKDAKRIMRTDAFVNVTGDGTRRLKKHMTRDATICWRFHGKRWDKDLETRYSALMPAATHKI